MPRLRMYSCNLYDGSLKPRNTIPACIPQSTKEKIEDEVKKDPKRCRFVYFCRWGRRKWVEFSATPVTTEKLIETYERRRVIEEFKVALQRSLALGNKVLVVLVE